VIIIYKDFIKKYIDNLKISHIKDYAQKQNIVLTEEESIILYSFIKEHYLELLEDDTTIYLLEKQISSSLFSKILILYQENKAKYL
jgi:hypothetical protein